MARVECFEILALRHVYYHMENGWPVQVQFMKQDTQSQCSGTTKTDRVQRELGGQVRMEGHMHPRMIHVDVWQKTSQYVKPLSSNLNRLIFFKKENWNHIKHLLRPQCSKGRNHISWKKSKKHKHEDPRERKTLKVSRRKENIMTRAGKWNRYFKN